MPLYARYFPPHPSSLDLFHPRKTTRGPRGISAPSLVLRILSFNPEKEVLVFIFSPGQRFPEEETFHYFPPLTPLVFS